MATVQTDPRGTDLLQSVALSTAQTGNGDSTNVARRVRSSAGAAAPLLTPAALVITSTIGATPTVTVNIQGSVDGTNFFNIPYALVSAPASFVLTALTITTAVTTTYILQPNQPWLYLKAVYSANTNVTLTTTAWL